MAQVLVRLPDDLAAWVDQQCDEAFSAGVLIDREMFVRCAVGLLRQFDAAPLVHSLSEVCDAAH